MLTGFKTVRQNQKTEELTLATKAMHHGMLELLQEALKEALQYNSFKIHIEGEPFRAEFKLPEGISLITLNALLSENKIQAHEIKTLSGGEILLHTFKILPSLTQTIEILYRPISRPRM